MKPLIGITSSLDSAGDISLRRQYCLAVLTDGGIPVILPPLGDPADALARCDGILLSGGGDIAPERYGVKDYDKNIVGAPSPERDDYELALAKLAFERDIPTLGICRGVQVMNAALGGTLHLDIPGHRQTADRPVPTHSVTVMPGTRLREITGADTVPVNSFHHQAVDRPAPPLRVCAVTDSGITEGVEAPQKRFYIGVQWHPEHMPKGAATAVIEALVDAARHES